MTNGEKHPPFFLQSRFPTVDQGRALSLPCHPIPFAGGDSGHSYQFTSFNSQRITDREGPFIYSHLFCLLSFQP